MNDENKKDKKAIAVKRRFYRKALLENVYKNIDCEKCAYNCNCQSQCDNIIEKVRNNQNLIGFEHYYIIEQTYYYLFKEND